MKTLTRFKTTVIKTMAACLLLMPVFSASASDDVAVSIHAVNYSNQEFEYSIHDPKDKANSGAGESISRFGAGGTMCCYSLPRKWRPDLKVKIDFTVYLSRRPDGTLPKTTSSTYADIPQYSQPQELWVVRDVEGKMVIVISNFEPDHPKWSGKVKGWPVPSLAYQRERMDLHIMNAKGTLKAIQELSDDVRNDAENSAKEAWDFAELYDRDSIKGYSGYRDKKYQISLVNEYKNSLISAKRALSDLERRRP